MKNLILFILLIITASLIQNSYLFNFYGIKPNIVLVVLLTAIPFMVHFLDYLILIFLAGVLLQASAAFLAVSFGAYFFGNYLPWRQSLNNLTVIACATIVFHLLAAPAFLYHNWDIALKETTFNLILGTMVYFALWPKRSNI